MLAKRLEDLDYRIAQFRRETHHESRLRRRRDALAAALERTEGTVATLTRILKVEEGKLEGGMGLFHKGLERLMIEDLVAVENLEVFKAAGQHPAVRHRLADITEEVADIDSAIEARRDRHEHLDMLESWRADMFDALDLDGKSQNALLHQRLDAWLKVADLGDDIEDLAEAGEFLESTLGAIEDAIIAGTRVRTVEKHDLAVVAALQPPRSRQFQLMEMVRHVQLAYRTVAQLIDHLQGIEHLQVHMREPERLLADFLEALLIDHYEGGPPKHAMGTLTENHMYLLQVRDGLRARVDDVEREVESLEVKEDELFHLSIDHRIRRAVGHPRR